MIQDFCFETDNLKHFELALRFIVDVALQSEGEFIQHHISLREPGYWNDGREESIHQQPYIMSLSDGEHDKHVVLDRCGCYGGAPVLEILSLFLDKDQAARRSCEQAIPPRPTRKFLASLFSYRGDLATLSPTEVVHCNGKSDMITKAIDLVRGVDAKSFFAEFEHAVFPEFDGSFGLAFRVQYHPVTWGRIDLSLAHFYYGK